MRGEDFKKKILRVEPRLATLARKLGISSQALNQYLSASDVKTGFAERVASALGVSVKMFFDEELKGGWR